MACDDLAERYTDEDIAWFALMEQIDAEHEAEYGPWGQE